MATGGGSGRVFRNGDLRGCGDSMAPDSKPLSRNSDAFFLSGSSRFLGSSSGMVSFEDVNGSITRNGSRSFFTAFEEDNGDEDYEEYMNQAGKKRRLSNDQVQFLERSFEVENKLEPERKIQLAKELGLQPRQVAIWFQNRRARWKTKKMEKDYDALQASYNNLKSNYDTLIKENENLKAEVVMLAEKLASKDDPLQNAELSATSKQSAAVPISNSASEEEDSKLVLVEQKMDEFTSAKSDIFQPDSPRYADGVYSPRLEHVDSSYLFEPDTNNSDSSQDDDDHHTLPRPYLPLSSYMLPPLKHDDYGGGPSASSSSFVSAHEDTQPFWPWSF